MSRQLTTNASFSPSIQAVQERQVGPHNPAESFRTHDCNVSNRPPSALKYHMPGCVSNVVLRAACMHVNKGSPGCYVWVSLKRVAALLEGVQLGLQGCLARLVCLLSLQQPQQVHFCQAA